MCTQTTLLYYYYIHILQRGCCLLLPTRRRRKALGSPEGVAELQVFYCEQATLFAVECGYENESYFSALIRMFDESLVSVMKLPPDVQLRFLKRLDAVRASLAQVGWSVNDSLTDIWFDLVDEEVAFAKE